MNDETIALVVRETGWTLDYIRCLPVSEFYALVAELSYQKAVDDYRQECRFAALMATMGNLWSKRKVEVSELVGEPPERRKMVSKNILAKGTKIQTITLADGKEYELAPIDLNILTEMEDEFKLPLSEILAGGKVKPIRHLFYLQLKEKYPELTLEAVGKLVNMEVLSQIGKILGV